MTHFTLQNLDERHRSLEELRRAAFGLLEQPMVCRVCYAQYDNKGCYCGRNEWALVGLVVIEISLLIERLNREQRGCTSDASCVHCREFSESNFADAKVLSKESVQ